MASEMAEAPDQSIDAAAGRRYWQGVNADVNGMLGGIPSVEGFSSLSSIDLQGSKTFLARLGIGAKNGRRGVANALEGGAGIGRVTQGLLLHVAEQVDVVEPISKFTDEIRGIAGVRDVFNVGLEEWQPRHGAAYDLVWVQWCAGHLKDDQLVRFLRTAAAALTPETGVIVLKENVTTTGVSEFDDVDSTVTRGDAGYRTAFKEAGLRLIRCDLQRGFPEKASFQLFPVNMYALKP